MYLAGAFVRRMEDRHYPYVYVDWWQLWSMRTDIERFLVLPKE